MENESPSRIEEILNPPLLGDLRNYPLPFVLGRMGREKQDGYLRLKRGDIKKEIVFKGGATIEIRSNVINECLGRFLQRTGKISDSVYEESLKIMSAEGKKQGEVLLAMGAISPHELPEFLKKQAWERFLDLFNWSEGAYRFFPSADIKEPEISFGLELSTLIYEGVSTRFPKERIQVFLESFRNRTLVRSDRQTMNFDENRLKLSDRRVLKAINGRNQMANLLDRFGEAQALLYTLMVTGILGPVAEPRVEKASPRPAAAPPAISSFPPLPAASSVPEPGRKMAPVPPAKETDSPEAMPADPGQVIEEMQDTYEKLRDLDHFEVLGLKQDADPVKIKQSYFRLARQYHPDRYSMLGNEEIKKLANAIFALVSRAFSTIGNEEGRIKYLDSLRNAEKQANLEKGAEKLVNAELQYQKGEMLLKQKDYDQALESLEWAAKLNPEEPEYQMTLGWAIYKKYSATPPGDESKIREAARLIKQATEHNPRLDKGFYYLGTISKLTGKEDEARQHFTRALEINPHLLEAQRELRVFDMRKNKVEEKKGTFSRFFKR